MHRNDEFDSCGNNEVFTYQELVNFVDSQYENIHPEEYYMRIKYVDPTFHEWVLSQVNISSGIKENIVIEINDLKYEYSVIKN